MGCHRGMSLAPRCPGPAVLPLLRPPPSLGDRLVSIPVRWQTGRVCRPARRPGTSRSEECPALACAPPWHPGWNRSGGRRPFGASSPPKVLSDRPPTVRCRPAPRIHRQKSTVRSPSVVRPSRRWRLVVAPTQPYTGRQASWFQAPRNRLASFLPRWLSEYASTPTDG